MPSGSGGESSVRRGEEKGRDGHWGEIVRASICWPDELWTHRNVSNQPGPWRISRKITSVRTQPTAWDLAFPPFILNNCSDAQSDGDSSGCKRHWVHCKLLGDTHTYTSLSHQPSVRLMMSRISFFFPSPLLLSAWLPATALCKPQLSLLMYFAIWCTNTSDKYPQVQKGPLSTASYAAQHPSFYEHIMCTHMKHVWRSDDGWCSIGNRCAEMWQGQTIWRALSGIEI